MYSLYMILSHKYNMGRHKRDMSRSSQFQKLAHQTDKVKCHSNLNVQQPIVVNNYKSSPQVCLTCWFDWSVWAVNPLTNGEEKHNCRALKR